MTVIDAINRIAERFTANVTPEEEAALTKWFGVDWSIQLAAEYEIAQDEGHLIHLDEPTFREYAESKRAAREAAHALIARTVDKV